MNSILFVVLLIVVVLILVLCCVDFITVVTHRYIVDILKILLLIVLISVIVCIYGLVFWSSAVFSGSWLTVKLNLKPNWVVLFFKVCVVDYYLLLLFAASLSLFVSVNFIIINLLITSFLILYLLWHLLHIKQAANHNHNYPNYNKRNKKVVNHRKLKLRTRRISHSWIHNILILTLLNRSMLANLMLTLLMWAIQAISLSIIYHFSLWVNLVHINTTLSPSKSNFVIFDIKD